MAAKTTIRHSEQSNDILHPQKVRGDISKMTAKYPCPFFWNLDTKSLPKVSKKAGFWLLEEPDNIPLLNLMGFIYFERDKDTSKAKEMFLKVLTLQPDNLVSISSLAHVYEVSGLQTEAKKWYERLMRLYLDESGDKMATREAQSHYERGFILTRFGPEFYVEAEECLDRAIHTNDNNPEWLKALVIVLVKRLNRKNNPVFCVSFHEMPAYLDKVSQVSRKLMELQPTDGEHLCNLGEALMHAYNIPSCKEWLMQFWKLHPALKTASCFERAYNLSPHSQFVCEKVGKFYMRLRRNDDALPLFQYIAANYPMKSSYAHHQLGKLAMLAHHKTGIRKYLNDAIGHLECSIMLDETNANAMCYLGRILCQTGNHDGGMARFQKALEGREDADTFSKDAATIHKYWCIALLEIGEVERGYVQMKAALKYHGELAQSVKNELENSFLSMQRKAPSDPWPWLHRGRMRVTLKKWEEALELYTVALSMDRNNVHVIQALGEVYLLQGLFKDAKVWLRKAVDLGSQKASEMLQQIDHTEVCEPHGQPSGNAERCLPRSTQFFASLDGIPVGAESRQNLPFRHNWQGDTAFMTVTQFNGNSTKYRKWSNGQNVGEEEGDFLLEHSPSCISSERPRNSLHIQSIGLLQDIPKQLQEDTDMSTLPSTLFNSEINPVLSPSPDREHNLGDLWRDNQCLFESHQERKSVILNTPAPEIYSKGVTIASLPSAVKSSFQETTQWGGMHGVDSIGTQVYDEVGLQKLNPHAEPFLPCASSFLVKTHPATTPTKAKGYDIFVSYSRSNAFWVEETFVPKLEEYGFTVCFHERDFIPGKPIIDNIIESIEKCINFVPILTKDFIQSKYCDYEIQVAIDLGKMRDQTFLPIMYDLPYIDLPNNLRHLTAAIYRPSQEDDFWRKLVSRLQQTVRIHKQEQ